MGPEPEGTTDVDQEGLSSRPGPAGGVPPSAVVEENTGLVNTLNFFKAYFK